MTSKCSLDKCNQDYVQKTNNLLHVPVEPNNSFNPNLDSPTDLDDICTSISQVPINPLYFENPTSVSKIALPETKLLEDDRFWGVEKQSKMISKPVEVLDNQHIIGLTSESVDSFTPNKKKEYLPGSITRWCVALIANNLVIVGNDSNGKRQITSCCRRISPNIFHDNNGVVCSLLGPSEPDSDLPKYIADKFKLGIPEDWQSVVITWGHYQSMGCPSSYKWPSMSQSYSHVNNYETDTDIGQNRTTLSVQQLRKKITKMQTRYRTMLFRESLLGSCTNSIHDSSLYLSSNIDIPSSNLTNKICNININRTAESAKENSVHKVQSTVNKLFSSDKNIEVVSFHNKTAPVPEKILESDTKSDKRTDSFHLELISSEESNNSSKTKENQTKDSPKTKTNPKKIEKETKYNPEANTSSKTAEEKTPRYILSGSEIFPATETKTTEKPKSVNNLTISERSSFVSVNFSSLSKVSSIKELAAAQNAKAVPKNDSSKMISCKRNSILPIAQPSSLSDKSKNVNRIKLDLIEDKNNPDVCFKHPETVKKRGKNLQKHDSSTDKESPSKNQKNTQMGNTTETDTNTVEKEDFLKPVSPKVVKKRGRPCKKPNIQITLAESPRRRGRTPKNKSATGTSDFDSSEKDVAQPLNVSPNKQKRSEVFEDEIVPVTKNIDGFLKPPDIEIDKRGRKKINSATPESAKDIFRPSDLGIVKKRGKNTTLNSTKNDNLSQCSSNLSASNNSTLSSRGRVRVETLPFWQGHRLKICKHELVIEKSVTEKCNIFNYVNNDSISTTDISIGSKSLKKSPTYNEVFNKYVFKNSKEPVKMQLMSTLINDSINKTKQESPITNQATNEKRSKSPVKKVSSIKSTTKTKTKVSNSQPSPSKQFNARKQLSYTEERKEPVETNEKKNESTRKQTPNKRIKSAEETTEPAETNEKKNESTRKQTPNKRKKSAEETSEPAETNEKKNESTRKQTPNKRTKSASKNQIDYSRKYNMQDSITDIVKNNENSNKSSRKKSPIKKIKSTSKNQIYDPNNHTVKSNESDNESCRNHSQFRKITRSVSKTLNNNQKGYEIKDIKVVIHQIQSPLGKRNEPGVKTLNYSESPSKSCRVQNEDKNMPNAAKIKSKPSNSSTKKINHSRISPEKQPTPRKSTRKHADINYNEEFLCTIREAEISLATRRNPRKPARNKFETPEKLFKSHETEISLATRRSPRKPARNKFETPEKLFKSHEAEISLATRRNPRTPARNKFETPEKLFKSHETEMSLATRRSPRKPARNKFETPEKPRRQSKKYTTMDDFNFTIQSISSIKENIPKRNDKNCKVGPKITTQFKVPKPRKRKQFVIPSDPDELYLIATKTRKTKWKEAPVDRKTTPLKSLPKKRKLFESKNWLQSDECIKHLSQNNPEHDVTNSKFVLKFDPTLRLPEFDDDKFSEINCDFVS